MRCKICNREISCENITGLCFECKIRVDAETDKIKSSKGKINLNFSEHRFFSRSSQQ